MFIWILLKLGFDWEQAARRTLKICWKKSDRTLHRTLKSSIRSVHRRWTCCDGVTGLYCSASGQMVVQRSIKRRRSRQWGPNSGCVRLGLTGRVRTWFQGFWTSLESTGLWVAASGRCHRSVRSVENVRDSNSYLVFLFNHPFIAYLLKKNYSLR